MSWGGGGGDCMHVYMCQGNWLEYVAQFGISSGTLVRHLCKHKPNMFVIYINIIYMSSVCKYKL